MTRDFDLELRERLGALATAVPVHAGTALHAPIGPGVRPGLTSRRLAMSASFPLVIVVVGIVVAGLALVGPFAPAATGGPPAVPTAPILPEPSTSGAATSDTDGDLELTLWSDRSEYTPDELITIQASLTYRGPADSIELEPDSAGPVRIGIRERVFGGIDLNVSTLAMCGPGRRLTLHRDQPLLEPFKKSGGFPRDHPDASSFRAFLADPELRLPAGTWHVYAVSYRACMGSGPAYWLQAEIVITVTE